MRWDWLPRALGFKPDAWINIHSGFDESTPEVRALCGENGGRVFDIFTPSEMTEPSITRARLRRGQPSGAQHEQVDFRHLPIPKGTIEATLLLSAHELRTDEARIALSTELRRVLGPGGA